MARSVSLASLISVVVFALPSTVSGQAVETAETADSVVVELIDAGAAPRRELRFTPKQGDQQTTVMVMDMQMAMTVAGQQPPAQTMPAQRMTMKVVVDDVAPNGDISYSFVYTDMEVVTDPNNPSPAAAQIQQMIAPLIGMKGKGVSSNRGFAKSGSVEVPPNTPQIIKQTLDGMKEAMNRLSSPVPQEAIGLGARWNVVQGIEANGMKLKQSSVHELTELTEDGFALKITMKQTGDSQEVKNPALLPSIKLTLNSLNTTGTGTSKFANGSVLPVRSSVDAKSEVDMLMEMNGQQQKMTTQTTIKITLEPAEK